MKFKSIGVKLLACILPVVIVAMVVLTVISANSSRSIIDDQISSRMDAELTAQAGKIGEQLNSVSAMAVAISKTVETTYKTTDLATYEKSLAEIIQSNDIVLGSGIWFEPYTYDKNEKYVGPYIVKDGDKVTTTYDYSNEDYNYFNQDYYAIAKSTGAAVFTDPYYDETSGMIMSSCAMPMMDNNSYIGCITVDIELTSITNFVSEIKVGDGGSAILTTKDGIFIAGTSEEKIQNAANITEDENASLATAGVEILANESGKTTYSTDDEEYNLYYDTIPQTGWNIVIQMPQSELNAPVNELLLRLAVVCIIAAILVILVILLQIGSISKSIARVKVFAGSLAQGDFTVDPIKVKTKDELGVMGDSLNEMYGSNKTVISNISEHAVEIEDASEQLRTASSELADKFNEIEQFMTNVNNEMMNTSAATEEVNASTEEVLSNVNILVEETQGSKTMAEEIRGRASEVGETSERACEKTTELGNQFKERLAQSMENAKVVSSIGELANVISEIAEQINLLSLNASIEAARAGEAGRGFAVVATEIGSLAGNTTEAVGKIQETIQQVQNAFNGLSDEAQGMLDFLVNNVAPDYSNFVDVARQYGKDAESIENTSETISKMADGIRQIMNEVTDAIQNIADATQQTTDISSQIMDEIEVVGKHVNNVAGMSERQQDISMNLKDVVGKFKLEEAKKNKTEEDTKEDSLN